MCAFLPETLFAFKDSTGGESAGGYSVYTKIDPSAKGGIKGKVVSPSLPIEMILALPPDEPRFVYKGEVSGASKDEFMFKGLPMGKYNLIVIYDNRFYEGLELTREDNTLTKEDEKKINATVQKSEKFYASKVIHRMEGTTGRGNLARCVSTFGKFAENVDGGLPDKTKPYRRAFKLYELKDVGPGWQVTIGRDLYTVWARMDQSHPQHNYNEVLSKIRVTDYIKDLGEINLSKPN